MVSEAPGQAFLVREWKAKAEEYRQERDAALRLVDDLEGVLVDVALFQPRALGTIKREGFVFDDIGSEPGNWQHLAFTLYTMLCEANAKARAVVRPPTEAQ